MPTILLTESPDPASRARALRLGVDDACPKSIDIDELDARLSVLLRIRHREEQVFRFGGEEVLPRPARRGADPCR